MAEIDHAVVQRLYEAAAGESPWNVALQGVHDAALPVGEVLVTARIFPRDQYKDHVYYREMWGPHNVREVLGAKVAENDHYVAMFGVMRQYNRPRFVDEDIDLMRRYAPHLVAELHIAKPFEKAARPRLFLPPPFPPSLRPPSTSGNAAAPPFARTSTLESPCNVAASNPVAVADVIAKLATPPPVVPINVRGISFAFAVHAVFVAVGFQSSQVTPP